MKNQITQAAQIIIAIFCLHSLMGYTKPAEADKPKQYIVVFSKTSNVTNPEKLVADVNQKISEGWIPQGGIIFSGNGFLQPMVK